jgi:tripartite-type tricarboxylate transporter receptor subunit TctC
MKHRRHWTGACVLLLFTIGALPALAQTTAAYPSKPIRYIVPFPPGGMTDLISRIVAQRLGDAVGQQVIIDNRAGAGGTVGTELAARAPADGYTVALGFLGTFAIGPHVYGKVPYDPVKDFAPVIELAESGYLLAIHPPLAAQTVKDLVALSRTRPLNYATPGNGTPGHLAAELLKSLTGAGLNHVPYKGSGPGISATIAGETQMIIEPIASAMPHVKGGRMRALAVTSLKRASILADVPTIAESGVAGYEVTGWYGVVMPAGVPAPVIAKLNGEINQVLKSPAVREHLVGQGVELTGGTPAAFGERIRREMVRWAKIVKDSGARVD